MIATENPVFLIKEQICHLNFAIKQSLKNSGIVFD